MNIKKIQRSGQVGSTLAVGKNASSQEFRGKSNRKLVSRITSQKNIKHLRLGPRDSTSSYRRN